MKLLKLGLRFWITVTSIISFLMGWAMLAHSPKPVQTSSTQATQLLPTLSPLQPLNFNGGDDDSQSSPLFQTFNSPSVMPRFRTSGS